MRALSGVSRVAIIVHRWPCFMLTTISTKQYNFYHWSLLLGNDYIDHHQVRALARAAGPSHVLGSRGKVRSPFSFRVVKLEQLNDGIFFFPVNVVILPFPKPYCPWKLLQIGVLSSHQHQGTEPPSLAQQSGLSTQSCQKTSTNDTKVREKLCDLSLYLSTYRPIQKKTLRMQFFITGLVRERGDSSCVHKHWAAQSKGSFFCIFKWTFNNRF